MTEIGIPSLPAPLPPGGIFGPQPLMVYLQFLLEY